MTVFVFNRVFHQHNHKNYNFVNCDWFEKLLFPTNSLAKLLSVCYRTVQQTNQIQSCSLNQPTTFKIVFKSTNHNLGFNHYRNSVQPPKFMHPLSVFFLI